MRSSYVSKEILRNLGIKRITSRKNVIHQLSRDEEQVFVEAVRNSSTSIIKPSGKAKNFFLWKLSKRGGEL